MAVIRQFPDNSGCSVCNSLVDLPHRDVSDCRNALAKEMDDILKRAPAAADLFAAEFAPRGGPRLDAAVDPRGWLS